ncbi:ParB/RepB/Spo0J family partition protein [Emcibacter nanhaiensis]|uniref:ParB/Sulfiredoxin domain-containing protein n=1 Tax=Emcibacter nanhaiensis TaxID=1505037 RepID=A0A501PTJ9_9PROT|nr:ParB/RepB/Spo0J family partition protein [Emcibacter nanhaiensis]TPD63031.1 hypothetical protein FIV46_02830 [Emcibacter nanhaiensis]
MTSVELDLKHLARLDLEDGIKYLQGFQTDADTNREDPERVELSEIKLAPSVFQPRLRHEESGADYQHVKELARAQRSVGTETDLGKLFVMSINGAWFLVDGHHRYEAYKRNGISRPVGVSVFKGTVLDATFEATNLNTCDHLQMSSKEKSQRAWALTVATYNPDAPRQSTKTVKQIVDATKIGDRHAKQMRSVVKTLREQGEDPASLTWERARWKANGEEIIESSDDWREQQAQKLAQRLGKLFGKRLARHPDVTLRALELYSLDLYKSMLEELKGDFESAHLPTDILVGELGRKLESDPDLKETTLETLQEVEEVDF